MFEEHPLVAEYRRSIPTKLENLKNLVEAFKKQKDPASLDALRREVHKLAGSAGTYGFTTVSSICKSLDLELEEKIQNFQIEYFSKQWFLKLEDALIKITQAFEEPDQKITF